MVARTYAASAFLLWLLAYSGWPWSAILTWPALSLTLVAFAYLGAGTAAFGKTRGRTSWATALLLGPFLLGNRVSFRHYRRLGPAWSEVAPGLLMGRRLNEREAEQAVRSGVTAVLDLTAEYSESEHFLSLAYKNVQVLDITVPTVPQLREAVEFMEEARAGQVYVHCALGYGRSVGPVAAYLLAQGIAPTVEAALEQIRAARPPVVVRPQLIAVLREYQAQCATPRASRVARA